MGIIWFLLIGLCAGFLAGKIVKGSGFGVLINMVVGCIGALIGGLLLPPIGIVGSGLIGSLLVATLGAIILIVILGLLKGK